MTPEEIDAIRRIAYRAGYDEGETEAIRYVAVLAVIICFLSVVLCLL